MCVCVSTYSYVQCKHIYTNLVKSFLTFTFLTLINLAGWQHVALSSGLQLSSCFSKCFLGRTKTIDRQALPFIKSFSFAVPATSLPHPLVLAQPNVLEIVLDDHVRHRVKHKLDVAGVSGTSEVRVDFFCLLVAVEVLKLPLHIHSRLLIGVLALVVSEADRKRDTLDLLGQKILLVQEENERGIGEPVVVADGIEQTQALCHTALWGNHRQEMVS